LVYLDDDCETNPACDRGFRRTKAVAGSQRATRPSALSLRIIVPPLWMPDLNLRSIESLVTILLVLGIRNAHRPKGENNALPLGKSRV